MRIVGLPDPPALWLGYLIPELLVSVLMIAAQLIAKGAECPQVGAGAV
jgi:hypothetical protein